MNLRDHIEDLAAQVQDGEGTDLRGALRDILTEIWHIANDNKLDIETLDRDSYDVFIEEEEYENE